MGDLWDGCVQLQSYNYPKHLAGFGEEGEVSLRGTGKRVVIKPSLSGEGVSFQSFDKDNFYWRHYDSEIYCEDAYNNRSPDSFNDDASFRVHTDKFFPGTVSFESVNNPGNFIRHSNYRLRIDPEEDDEVYQKDASWRLVDGPYRMQSKNFPNKFMGLDDNEGYMNEQGDEFYIIRPGMVGGSSAVTLNPCCHDHDRVFRHYCDELNADIPGNCENAEGLPSDASFYMHDDRFAGGYFALESVNFPNRFVRHSCDRLRTDEDDGSDIMHDDACFRAVKGPMAIASYNYPDRRMGFDDKEGYLQDSGVRFWIVPAINHQGGAVSLQAVDRPDFYFRHYDYEIDLENRDDCRNLNGFSSDASFKMKEDVWFEGTVVFEAVNFPGHYIRHQCNRLKLSPDDGSDLFRQDASFRLNLDN